MTRLLLVMLLALLGCAPRHAPLSLGDRIVHAPSRAYHWAYCDRMAPDGKHCQRWATACGTLDCRQ